jgi:hypothetical protein
MSPFNPSPTSSGLLRSMGRSMGLRNLLQLVQDIPGIDDSLADANW